MFRFILWPWQVDFTIWPNNNNNHIRSRRNYYNLFSSLNFQPKDTLQTLIVLFFYEIRSKYRFCWKREEKMPCTFKKIKAKSLQDACIANICQNIDNLWCKEFLDKYYSKYSHLRYILGPFDAISPELCQVSKILYFLWLIHKILVKPLKIWKNSI